MSVSANASTRQADAATVAYLTQYRHSLLQAAAKQGPRQLLQYAQVSGHHPEVPSISAVACTKHSQRNMLMIYGSTGNMPQQHHDDHTNHKPNSLVSYTPMFRNCDTPQIQGRF
jgi:hypothetical protein